MVSTRSIARHRTRLCNDCVTPGESSGGPFSGPYYPETGAFVVMIG